MDGHAYYAASSGVFLQSTGQAIKANKRGGWLNPGKITPRVGRWSQIISKAARNQKHHWYSSIEKVKKEIKLLKSLSLLIAGSEINGILPQASEESSKCRYSLYFILSLSLPGEGSAERAWHGLTARHPTLDWLPSSNLQITHSRSENLCCRSK